MLDKMSDRLHLQRVRIEEEVSKPKQITEPHQAQVRNLNVPQMRQAKQAIKMSSRRIP